MTKLEEKKILESLAEEAEDLKTLCRINKILNNGSKNNDFPVKDINGNVLWKKAEKLARFKYILYLL